MHRKSLKSGILTLTLLGVVVVAIRMLGGALPDRLHGRATVVDGDSLVIDGHRVRIVGLDAPELGQTCTANGRDVACGEKAKAALKALVTGREVECTVLDEDRYQRLLARCFVGDDDIGARQVSAGWAIATDAYHAAENAARLAKSGIWSMDFIDPADWREGNGDSASREGFWPWF